jgi:hypothetical protein
MKYGHLNCIIALLLTISNKSICCPRVLDQALWKMRSLDMDNFFIYSWAKIILHVLIILPLQIPINSNNKVKVYYLETKLQSIPSQKFIIIQHDMVAWYATAHLSPIEC